MGDTSMDSNMNLLLEAGISSAMFDIDPGDEVNHPAQQFLNSADGHQSISVAESPNFGSLSADNAMDSPPLLNLQGDLAGVGKSVLSDAASSVPLPQESHSVAVPAPANRSPTVVPAAALATSTQSNDMFSADAGSISTGTRLRSDSEAMRKSTAMLKEQWMSRYHELTEWKRKHGNCNVPQREKKLGCWVSTQRTQYKLLLEGRQSQMNQERIDLLSALDFDWDPRGIWKRVRKGSIGDDIYASPTTVKGADRNDRKWMIWYDQLVRFKEKHGHCIVTRKQDNSLGIWVQKQRKFFRERQAGKTNILTTDKVELLNNIGFSFVVCPGTKSANPATHSTCSALPEQSKEEATMKEVAKDEWHQNLDELRQYKAIFGDCLVPDNSEYSELFAWTVVQRREQGTMQRDRKRELDCLQFEWDGMRKDEDSDRWDQMFFELSQYKVINAHTNVQPWPNEPRVCELSAWCNIQRRDYANLWADRRSPLTENRIRQLNQLGFDWAMHSDEGYNQDDEDWAAKLEQLRQYHVANGHTNVPRHHGALGVWVDTQRIAMKNMLEGNATHLGRNPQMTWERFSRLEALGFEFTVRSALSSDEKAQKASSKSQ